MPGWATGTSASRSTSARPRRCGPAATGHERALRALARTAADRAKIRMLRSYDPDAATDPAGLDVPDPYYGGEQGFQHVLDLVEAACAGLLAELEAQLAASGRGPR